MSYVNLNYHLITATKERKAFITAEIRERLVKYIGGIIRNLDGALIEANGPEDHLHMAVILNARHTVSDVMREIKAHSSGWVHETFPGLRVFGWQDGYAAFSVSHSQLPAVVEYIRRQLEHHHKMTFEEELAKLLKLHAVEFDPKYLLG